MKVVLMELRVALGTAAMSICSSVDSFSNASNAVPPIRRGLAESFKVS